MGQDPSPSPPFLARARGSPCGSGEREARQSEEAGERAAENLSCGGREGLAPPVSLGAKPPEPAPLSHQTSLIKHKFRDIDEIIKNFKMATDEH